MAKDKKIKTEKDDSPKSAVPLVFDESQFDVKPVQAHKLKCVLERISCGIPIVQSCKDAGTNYNSLMSWVNAKPENRKLFYKAIDNNVPLIEEALQNNALYGNNVVAQIFYLKNRLPDRYKDKVESEVSGNVSLSFADFIKPQSTRLNA